MNMLFQGLISEAERGLGHADAFYIPMTIAADICAASGTVPKIHGDLSILHAQMMLDTPIPFDLIMNEQRCLVRVPWLQANILKNAFHSLYNQVQAMPVERASVRRVSRG